MTFYFHSFSLSLRHPACISCSQHTSVRTSPISRAHGHGCLAAAVLASTDLSLEAAEARGFPGAGGPQGLEV